MRVAYMWCSTMQCNGIEGLKYLQVGTGSTKHQTPRAFPAPNFDSSGLQYTTE